MKNLKKIREMLGLSQKELAEKLNVHVSLISKWEKGERRPSAELLFELSKILGLSIDFILNYETKYNIKFRSKRISKKNDIGEVLKDLTQLIYYIFKSYETLNQLPEKFNYFMKFDFHDFKKQCDEIKELFKLNRIVSYSELKEALIEKNIHVFEWILPMKVSGISYREDIAVIVINYNHSKERRLFTLAHELAHIIFHLNEIDTNITISEVSSINKTEEKIANLFAAELLMPSDEFERLVEYFKDDIRNPLTLDTIAKFFNVSREAVFYRLAEKKFFDWKEKSKFFSKINLSEVITSNRVENIDEQVSKKFLINALTLYANEKISTGKLSEWLFIDKIRLEEYLSNLYKTTTEELIIGVGI